jgi:transposase
LILRSPAPPVEPRPPRFRKPPWDRSSPQWADIDGRLGHDHTARLVDEVVARLDLSPLVESYAGTGSEAYPPGLMLRVVLYQLALGEDRPRWWADACRFHEPTKWLAFGLQPSRSRLHAFQHRLGGHLAGWFRQVIDLAVARGITTATRGAIDGSTVAANASRHRLLKRKTLDRRLEPLARAVADDEAGGPPARADADDGAGGPPAAPPWWMAETPRGRRRQLDRYRRARAELERRVAENARRKAERRRDPEKIVIAPADPEAAVGRDKLKVYRPLYNAGVVYDLDSELILAAEVFCQQNDAGTLRPMLSVFTTWTGHAPEVLLADSSYATVADMRACAEAGVGLYAPYQSNDFSAARGAPPKMFPKDRFVWDEAGTSYTCPAGHAMPRESSRTERRAGDEAVVRHIHRCPAGHCAVCPLAAACTPNPSAGRTVSRVDGEERIEELKARMRTDAAKALYKLRCRTVERAYADVKVHRRLDRFPGRGRAHASAHFGLRCLVHDLLVVARHMRAQEEVPKGTHDLAINLME